MTKSVLSSIPKGEHGVMIVAFDCKDKENR
jgi:hypothetical protein